jgi:apolipoprotein N-acyltransferase
MTTGLERAAPAARRLATLKRGPAAAVALGAGLLAGLGFEPVGLLAGPLLGVALLLLLLHLRPRGEAFLTGFLFGFGQFLVGLTWIATAFVYQGNMPVWMGWVAVVGLSAFLSIYPGFAALLARRWCTRLVPLALLFAGLFALTEILRGLLFTGFAWNPLGAAWLALPGVAQLAAVVGANGLSALLVLAAGSFAALAAGRGEPGRAVLVGVLPLLLLMGVLVPRVQAPVKADGPVLLLVQTGTRIEDKHADGGLVRSLEAAVLQTRAALATGPAPAAVVWPEATVEFPMEELPDLRRQLVAGFAPGTRLLTGGVALERDASGQVTGARNSLYALDATGNILARYDKAHLVPGGEYLPLRWLAEPLGLSRLVPGTLDFLPGEGPVTWLDEHLPPMSPNICYEIIFPGAVALRGSDRPAFILTVSNDAWFGRLGPPQHHAQARLRAIEEGLPVARVTPTGITGMIGPRGELVATIPGKGADVLRQALPAPLPPPPFARLGLLMPLLFAALLGAIALVLSRDKKT